MGKGLDFVNNTIFPFKLGVTIEITTTYTKTTEAVGTITDVIVETTKKVFGETIMGIVDGTKCAAMCQTTS